MLDVEYTEHAEYAEYTDLLVIETEMYVNLNILRIATQIPNKRKKVNSIVSRG